MPLHTQIERDGEAIELRWGDFHVAAMICAASWDSGTGPFETNSPPDVLGTVPGYPEEPCPLAPATTWSLTMYPIIAATPLNKGSYTLTREHKFVDVTDGEVLHLLPGDVLSASRS